MVEMTGIYQGEKHCELRHGPSKAKISTDAPRDNNGKGEAFSPTDLVGAALGSCIITTIAIACEKENISVEGAKFTVRKEMQASPRRIASLSVMLEMPAGIPLEKQSWLQRIAEHCPVGLSLSPDTKIIIEFMWN